MNFGKPLLRITFLLLIWANGMSLLQAQTAVKVQIIEQALQNDDFAAAGNLIHSIWAENPKELYKLGDAAYTYFVNAPLADKASNLKESRLDSLLQVYEAGIHNDPFGPNRWLIDRFFLLSIAPKFEKSAQRWAFEAIVASPMTAYNLIYKKWAEAAAKAYSENKLPLKNIVNDWRLIDENLLLKELAAHADASDAARTRNTIRHLMRQTLPDCDMVVANFQDGIQAGNLDQAALEAFLMLHSLQNCADESLWEKAFSAATKQDCKAWLFRTAGEMALSQLENGKALDMFEKAAECEVSPQLKALDLLQIATLALEKADFQQAKVKIQAAMDACPTWGEPYLRMIDLYSIGSRHCDLSNFDRKALNWLLIEYCEKMANADPSYSIQATNLSYRFWQATPSAEEAAFRGLAEGDSWPLKCWMSTTVRVKLR